mgnify:CR=1 FL=1
MAEIHLAGTLTFQKILILRMAFYHWQLFLMDHYFNQVLDAFSKMNRNRLEELLDPTLSYFDVPVGVFLSGLERVFGKFRKAGDSFLEVQSGHCRDLTCNPDKIRTAYRFVGNSSRDFLDLRFILELTEDLKDHRVLDIFQCFNLHSQEPSEWYGNRRLLSFYFDEEFPEKISVEEKIHTQLALEGMRSLENLPMLRLEEAQAWIVKHEVSYQLFNQVALDRGDLLVEYSWGTFKSFFFQMKAYLELYTQLQESGALQEVFFWEVLPDPELFQKIRMVENLMADRYAYFLLKKEVSEKVQLSGGEQILLGGDKFDQLESFWRKYFELQIPLVDRFFVFTDKEVEAYYASNYDLNDFWNLSLLSFHLDYREDSRKKGKIIPEWRRR